VVTIVVGGPGLGGPGFPVKVGGGAVPLGANVEVGPGFPAKGPEPQPAMISVVAIRAPVKATFRKGKPRRIILAVPHSVVGI